MRLCKVSDIFEVKYGVDLELNSLDINQQGINFVSRTSKNNGVSAKVSSLPYIISNSSDTISVSCGGSVMEAFLQCEPYYSGRDLFCLTAKINMPNNVKLFYCHCLRMNKFKYSYGRQANETLRDLLIPVPEDIPSEILNFSIEQFQQEIISNAEVEGLNDQAVTNGEITDLVSLDSIFELCNGLASTSLLREDKRLSCNWIPYVRPSYRQETSVDAYVNKNLIGSNYIFPEGTLYVSTNGQGSHTYSYVSIEEFVPNSDVTVLIPKRDMTIREKLFYALCITKNRFKFSYGRKPKGNRLRTLLVPRYIPSEFNECNLENLIIKK